MKKCITGLMVLFAAQYANATIHNVPGDFPDIQTCINFAVNGDECLVAPGTYNELINFNGKAITLRSSDGADATIIDGTEFNDSVVKCISSEGPNTVLEGFTITGGTGSPCAPSGGGSCGGGMFNLGTSPTVTNCTFSGNMADLGGGMYNHDGGNPTLINCTFSGNSATSAGGGMYNTDSSPTVDKCVFSENAADWGGGMFIQSFNPFMSSPMVINCQFLNNSAVVAGGGMNNQNSNPILANCLFSGNSASGNPPGSYGGGMSNSSHPATVTNCTFTGNMATADGGGMWNSNNGNPTVTNSILWGNAPDQIADASGSVTTVSHSNVQSGWEGTGNMNIDPHFVDVVNADFRLMSDSLCINAGNIAFLLPDLADLDGDGDTLEPTPFDLDGLPRTVCDVDMGAYEFQAFPVLLSNPPNCAIDARQPHDPLNSAVRFGWTEITFGFGCSPGSFSVTVEEGMPPAIIDEIQSEDTFTLVLDEPIPAGQWTCFTLDATDAQVCLGYLPADVNGDGVSAPSDILAVIDSLNGVVPLPEYATDANRSGVSGPEDILRVIDLLNGAAAFEPWLDVMLSDCPSGN